MTVNEKYLEKKNKKAADFQFTCLFSHDGEFKYWDVVTGYELGGGHFWKHKTN